MMRRLGMRMQTTTHGQESCHRHDKSLHHRVKQRQGPNGRMWSSGWLVPAPSVEGIVLFPGSNVPRPRPSSAHRAGRAMRLTRFCARALRCLALNGLLPCALALSWAVLPCTAAASERGSPELQIYDAQMMGGSNLNTDLAQLPDGRLLVANMVGLLRFDGVRWELATHPRKLGGMEHLALGPGAKIYTSFNGDIGYFQDDAGGQLQWHSLLDRVPLAATSFDNVLDVSYDAKRRAIWIVTDELVVFVPEDNGAVRVVGVGDAVNFGGLVGDEYWIQHGLAQVASRIDVDSDFALVPIAGSELLRGHKLWVGAPGDGDFKLVTNAGRLLRYRDGALSLWSDAMMSLTQSPGVRAMIHLADGRYVLGADSFAAVVVDNSGRVVDRYDAADGMPDKRRTHGLLQDREGDVWLAQDNNIVRVSMARAVTVYDESRGLASASDVKRWQGKLYASSTVGLFRLEADAGLGGGRFERALSMQTAFRSLAVLDANTLLAVNGNLFAITLDVAGKAIARKVPAVLDTEVLEASRFVPGRVWLGHGSGVQRIEKDAAGNLVVTSIPGLTNASYRVSELDADTLWVADRVDGVLRVDVHGARPPRHYGIEEGLPAGQVRIYTGAHRIWFTTMMGLRIYDAASDRFIVPPGLPASLQQDRLYCVLEDADDNLWVRGGAIQNDLFWREGDGWRADGTLLGVVAPFPTIFGFMREGDIAWAIRATGLLRYDLAAHQRLPPPPLPLLTQVVDLRAKANLPLAGLGALGADVRDVRLEFALPVLHRPEATGYRSRLRGYDNDWSDWSSAGASSRVFTNLPDGQFDFEVEALDGYLRTAALPPQRIVVAPRWWRSPLARSLYVLAALLSLWLAARWGARRRHRQFMLRQRELEAVVEQRTDELRLRNTQLAEQAERLTEVDRLKTRFFINVGHEFRTPLTLVLGPLDDLLRDAGERLSSKVREQLQMAHRNANRVLDLIVELLDVNRFEQGQMRLTPVPTDLGTLAPRAMNDHQPLLDRYGHHGSFSADDAGPWWAAIDPTQFERCLSNLISNAAKYMARGGCIEVVLRLRGATIELAVTDQGRGIDAEALPHVFDRFFQAEGSDRASGYGIGLALVREIVEAHDGRVEVASVVGVGSTFTLILPALAQAALVIDGVVIAPSAVVEPALLATAASAESMGAGGALRPTILIVDDHADLRARARGLLVDRFDIIEAADGLQAWHLARDRLPDLIVSDVMMPGIDGVELTRRLRDDAETAAIAVLLLTAKAGSEHAVAGLRAGADDYLSKPFDASELLARIDALLARAQRLRLRLARERQPPALVAEPNASEPPTAVESAEQRWRRRLDALIEQRLDDATLSVEALAEAMHMDRSNLLRRCKEILGMSPSEYLRDTRLRRAHGLLEQGAGSMSEIGYAVGFDSLSSFTRAFKLRYGHPPSQVAVVRRAG